MHSDFLQTKQTNCVARLSRYREVKALARGYNKIQNVTLWRFGETIFSAEAQRWILHLCTLCHKRHDLLNDLFDIKRVFCILSADLCGAFLPLSSIQQDVIIYVNRREQSGALLLWL
jgi:hypothetical protein